jgi:hypothetical protein
LKQRLTTPAPSGAGESTGFAGYGWQSAWALRSEVLGHVDLLTNDGRVREVDRGGTSVFEAA